MAKGGYVFYLDTCMLPIAPEKLQLKINNANETVTLINEGEINIMKAAGLTDIEFECEIPQVEYPFASYNSGFQGASYFLDIFESLKTNKKSFQFIVSRTRPNGTVLYFTNIKVSMEDYQITESAGNGFDLTVKIKLKQYREYSTKIVNVTVSTAKATVTTNRAGSVETPQTYTVQSGDCLWNIAKMFYNSGSDYTAIYDANSSLIESTAQEHGLASSSNGHWIYPGTVLTIPAT